MTRTKFRQLEVPILGSDLPFLFAEDVKLKCCSMGRRVKSIDGEDKDSVAS
jgi:hypothetical protein